MLIPEVLRFYPGYNLLSLLDEYGRAFFSLVNAMYRIQAREMLDNAVSTNAGFSGDDVSIDKLKKATRGIHGLVKEVRTVRHGD